MKAIKKRKYLKNLNKIKVDKSNAKGFKISHRSLPNHLMENHQKEKVFKIMNEIINIHYF